MKFDWDSANTEHIARHGIAPEEAEEAILIEPLEAAVQQHLTEQRVLCFGRTKSGRLLGATADGSVYRTAREDPRRHGL